MFRFALVMAVTMTSMWAQAQVISGFNGRLNNLSDVSSRKVKLEITGICQTTGLNGRPTNCGKATQKLAVKSDGVYNFKTMRIPTEEGFGRDTYYKSFMMVRIGNTYMDEVLLMTPDHVKNQLAEMKNATLLTVKPGKVQLVAPSGTTADWIRRYGYRLYVKVTVVEPGTSRKVIWETFDQGGTDSYIKDQWATVSPDFNKPILIGTSATAFVGKPVDLIIQVSGAGAGETYVAKVRVKTVFGKNVLQKIPPILLGEERDL